MFTTIPLVYKCKRLGENKLRRLILIVTILFIFAVNAVSAAGNFLNSVVLEGTENGYNVVLRSDARVKVKKSIKSNDSMVLTLRGITAADNINTLYKNTTSVNNIIVESAAPDEVKVYINAKDIAKANVILSTPNSAPLAVGDRFAREKMVWTGFSVIFLLLMIHSIKSQNRRIVRKMNMRDREIEFYKATIPSINYKVKNTYSTIPTANNARTLRQFQNLTKF